MFFNKSKRLLQEKEIELNQALAKLAKYETDFKDVLDKDKILDGKNSQLKSLEEKLTQLDETYKKGLNIHSELEKEISLYQEDLEISSYGLYKPRFSYDTSERYKEELEQNYESQKQSIKNGFAVVSHTCLLYTSRCV